MKIYEINLPGETVKIGDAEIALQGLSFDAVSAIVRAHSDIAATLFQQFTAGKNLDPDSDLRIGKLGEMGMSLLAKAPRLLTAIFVHGLVDSDGGTQEEMDAVAKFPLPILMEGVEKIGRLTFGSEEAVGKLVETAIQAFEGVTSVTRQLGSAPSPSL